MNLYREPMIVKRLLLQSLGSGFLCLLFSVQTALAAAPQRAVRALLDKQELARQAFGNDAPWYLTNIPFLEIDSPEIQRTYYYRWQLYRAHMREIGPQGTDETEFLPSVPWARHPYEDLNDSSSFHLLEGRWLRDPRYVTSLVDHLYGGGGNDRHFSESIAAATLAWTKVTGDPVPALRHLDAMQHIYNLWDDHFDAGRNLYWVEPVADATEYTISSIDASGAGFAKVPAGQGDGFNGGFAFRPSINAYQFGNALAIAELARIAGQPTLAETYRQRAEAIRTATLAQLWNPALQHFTDIYQRSTATVKAGDFIRGRELVGFVPWQFELPPMQAAAGSPEFGKAWAHALSADELGGAYGLRTVEPTYARYMTQYRYDKSTGLPECQWNGPSWPFQTSQTLSGMANLLHDYPHAGVTANDYVRLLRQYTRQHQRGARLDLEEDYNPDTGAPIVGLPRSHHYNHSTYIDLVLSGLLGIRPHLDNVFEIDPLLPVGGSEPPIHSFALEGLRYHGHDLTIVYDEDGKRYGRGAGITVWSDGKLLVHSAKLKRVVAPLPLGQPAQVKVPVDLAVNVWGRPPSRFEQALPIPTASSTADDSKLYEAIDGRRWFYPEIPHGWSPKAGTGESWYSVDLRASHAIGSVELAFFADSPDFAAPESVRLQLRNDGVWKDVGEPVKIIANGVTTLELHGAKARELRVVLPSNAATNARVRLVSFKVFAAQK